ncbi:MULTISPECIES: TROVE domain-containing protein [Niastella]|uniref:TROVE domain-containing protein n=1 Tax=Niastella soli TaxID=2821487 RepID=A0ABS3Z3N7_9BACT|nr:TROVE domain-containing protein [Niastella soli]MBO9204782.1 TROVE domain-containing protein [Niastella soli]
MRFNFRSKEKTALNHAGAKAYTLTPEMELYSAIATTMLNDTFYEKADDRLARIKDLMTRVKTPFIAKLAVYARTEMNLRTAPVVLATELAKIHKGNDLVRKTVEMVVKRPDEITELLAYYQIANERTGIKKLNRISKQLQKGLAASFNNFDEYQFAKYNRNTAVKLRDALFLVHPKAKDEAQQLLFNKIVNNELAVPYTWETELSALGQQPFESVMAKQHAVKAKWEELISSRKLGYMALLRNLRNILESDVSKDHMQMVYDHLTNPTAVRNSKQLPFRFLAAYKELKAVNSGYTSYIMKALENALIASVQNMKGFDLGTKVVIACDVSGSMQQPVSPKSKVNMYDIGLLLGMLLQAKCDNVLTGMFGDTWKMVPLPSTGILANVDAFYQREGEVGYSTNGYLVIKDLITKRYLADKIMLFTDTQMWDSNTNNQSAENTISYQWNAYKKIAPNAKLYVFDLAGHQHVPLKVEQNGVHLIAGWSDKVFEVMAAIENGTNAIDVIEKIAL